MTSSGCSAASTAAAVHDALCGSMAMTTRSVTEVWFNVVVPPLWLVNVSSGRAHQLSALQASLQPLPADSTGPGRKPSMSQPRKAAGMRASDPEPAPGKSGLQTLITCGLFNKLV